MAWSAALARLVQPEMIAQSCSPPAWSSVLDRAMSTPSDETATASVTPAVSSTKLPSSQLKFRASSVGIVTPRLTRDLRRRLLVEAALDPPDQARQEPLDPGTVDRRRRWRLRYGPGILYVPCVWIVRHVRTGARQPGGHVGTPHPADEAAGGAPGGTLPPATGRDHLVGGDPRRPRRPRRQGGARRGARRPAR